MNKKFYFKHAAFIILTGVVIFSGFYAWKEYQQKKFINYIDPKFTTEEIKKLDNQILDLEKKITEEKKGNNNDEIYRQEVTLGIQYEVRGRLLEAKNILTDATILKPANAVAWSELAIVQGKRTDYKSAEADIKKAIFLNPTYVQYHRTLIDLAKGPLKYSNEALKTLFEESLRQTNEDIDVITFYARYLEEEKDLAGAVAQWRKAQQKNPVLKDVYEQEIVQLQAQLK